MAKKKKFHHHKKDRPHVAPAVNVTDTTIVARPEGLEVASQPSAPSRRSPQLALVYDPAISHDALRTLALAGSLAAAQIILWLLMTQTSLGPTIYGWVKL